MGGEIRCEGDLRLESRICNQEEFDDLGSAAPRTTCTQTGSPMRQSTISDEPGVREEERANLQSEGEKQVATWSSRRSRRCW